MIGLVAFLPFPSWQQLVGFVSSATVLSFASGPLVFASLRQQMPDKERPFRLPGGHTIPLLAFWGSNLIVYWSGWTTVWKLMIAVLLGFVLLGVFMATGGLKGKSLDLKSGIWVLPWLGGLTLHLVPRQLPRAVRRQPGQAQLRDLDRAGAPALGRDLRDGLHHAALARDQAQAYIDETDQGGGGRGRAARRRSLITWYRSAPDVTHSTRALPTRLT